MGHPSSGIGVVDKSAAILAAVAAGPRTLAELVEVTGLPRATAHRLAVALEVHRLVARDADGRFVLGARVGELAHALPDALVAAAVPVLAWVRDECGESAQLYRRDGVERVCVAAAERISGLRTTVPVGTRLPLTAGSGAQVLCAWSDADAARDLLAASRFSARSLGEVRRRGWAQSVAQREAGVASVSAPVFGPDSPADSPPDSPLDSRPDSRPDRASAPRLLAAISISGPIERLGRAPGARFAPVLVAGAARIRAALS